MSDKHWPITAAMCLSRPGKRTALWLSKVNNDSFALTTLARYPAETKIGKKWERPTDSCYQLGKPHPQWSSGRFSVSQKDHGELDKAPRDENPGAV
jgi:hypothetical protein